MRIYVAGPMTGHPELNFPAFHAAAATLRMLGHHVENPAEINPDQSAEWLDCMRADIAQLVTCDAVYMLQGWEGSRGAQLEYAVAVGLGLKCIYAVGDRAAPVSNPGNPRKASFPLSDMKSRKWKKTEGWRMVCGAVLHRTVFEGAKFRSCYDDLWTVSDPISGLAIARGDGMADAIRSYRELVAGFGKEWHQKLKEQRGKAWKARREMTGGY